MKKSDFIIFGLFIFILILANVALIKLSKPQVAVFYSNDMEENEMIMDEKGDKILKDVESKKLTDKNICEKIKISYNKYICREYIAINSKDSSLCNIEFLGKQSNVDGCVNVLSIELKDGFLCNKSSDPLGCQLNYRIGTNDLEECIRISGDDSSSSDWCLMRIGENRGDTSLCYKINNQFKKNSCLSSVAEKIKDVSICKNMVLGQDEIYLKDGCIINVAKGKRDYSLCNLVSEDQRDKCNYDAGKITFINIMKKFFVSIVSYFYGYKYL